MCNLEYTRREKKTKEIGLNTNTNTLFSREKEKNCERKKFCLKNNQTQRLDFQEIR
jgi:hypothetical protein